MPAYIGQPSALPLRSPAPFSFGHFSIADPRLPYMPITPVAESAAYAPVPFAVAQPISNWSGVDMNCEVHRRPNKGLNHRKSLPESPATTWGAPHVLTGAQHGLLNRQWAAPRRASSSSSTLRDGSCGTPSPAPVARAAPELRDVKYIFLLRHAESRWNVVMNALKGLDLYTMATWAGEATDADHGLSDIGIEQAEELREKIQKVMGDREWSHEEERFYVAFSRAKRTTILCSPMRRALQTANRVLPSQDDWQAIRLIREAKELRNYSWEYDCGSTADNVGNAIATNADLGEDAKRVDAKECSTQWWNDAADSPEDQESQALELQNRLTSDVVDSVVLVTHSNLIRRLATLFSERLEDDASRSVPTDLATAQSAKLRNCGVLGLRFIRVGSEWLVDDACRMFGSDFED